MRLIYDLTADDHFAGALALRRTRRKSWVYLLTRGCFALVLAFLLMATGLRPLAAVPVAIAMIAFFSTVDELEARRRVKKEIRRGFEPGRHVMGLHSDRLRVDGPVAATEWRLGLVADVRREGGFIFIRSAQDEHLLVPEHGVVGGDTEAFVGALADALRASAALNEG